MTNLIKQLFLTFIVLLTAQIAMAQTECTACQKLLENGLYRTVQIQRKESFEKDLKTYFASREFRDDRKANKWGGEINVLIPTEGGPPTPAGLKANASDDEVSTFQSSIFNAKSIRLSQDFYESLMSSIPDVDLAKEYNVCVMGACKFGFRTFMDVGENIATFSISYRKEFESDSMPTIKNFAVINGEVLSGGVQQGAKLGNDNTVVIKRLSDKDLIFVLDTDRGAVQRRVPGEPTGFNKDLPLGTIIASYLNFEQFNATTSNNVNSPANVWTSRASKWSPADGRQVPNSKFSLITSQGNVPDLRGMFLRGLNYSEPSNVRLDDYADPEPNRQPGSRQLDAFQGHGHKYEKGGSSTDNVEGTFRGSDGVNRYGESRILEPTTNGKYGNARVEKETRPKNVAVYYYIRIN